MQMRARLESAVEGGRWTLGQDPATDSWSSAGPTLTEEFDRGEWQTIAFAYAAAGGVESWFEHVTNTLDRPEGLELNKDERELIGKARDGVVRALNTVRPHAGEW